MLKIGQMNALRVTKSNHEGITVSFGQEDILIPKSEITRAASPGETLEVFVFVDDAGKLGATTVKPRGCAEEIAYLKAIETNYKGAFLDWGGPQPLFLERDPDRDGFNVGDSYFVKLYLDDKKQMRAATGISEFLEREDKEGLYKAGEEVSLLISYETEVGQRAIINNSHWGMLYQNQTFRRIRPGFTMRGYIHRIRPDGRIDVGLEKPGYHPDRMDQIGARIVKKLEYNRGYLALHDKSAPEDIKETFGISKKLFKQAIGKLYKARVIRIESDGIYLID